ncbi:MAG: adenylylsulfate kinase [Herbinix sp.]|nr:adenylylsulfate kinase [Herbinix sp.]
MHKVNHITKNSKKIKVDKEAINKLFDTKNINWIDEIIKGDMPGDKIEIGIEHIKKARVILPRLLDILLSVVNEQPNHRAVIAVSGGSGVGKSEIAALLSFYLNTMGLDSYTLSGDNYPYRIPKYNDAERLRIFRQWGIQGLISHGRYTKEVGDLLKEFQRLGQDSNPEYVEKYSWLSIYNSAGRNGLKSYLGTHKEINFLELNNIISQFKNGVNSILLKRMGREEAELWYEPVDFSNKKVMIIEWTHSSNNNLLGVDIPILLNSTPEETLEHRKARNRDGAIDSPFTSMVLAIEQEMLVSQAIKAKIILAKSGDVLSYNDYIRAISNDINN